MDYPAMSTLPRAITPSVGADPIICNEFRQGRGYTNWRPHGSGDWLLIVTRHGAGRVRIKDRDILLAPGDAVLFAPGASQDYSSDQKTGHWHLRWAHFRPRPHWRPWLMWPQVAPQVGKVSLGGPAEISVHTALDRMLTANRLGGPAWEDLAMNALEEVLLWTFRLTSSETLAGVDARVQRGAHYLAAHPNEPFNLDKLAAYCGLSPSRFSHLFRSELGTTPQRFSEKLRLDFALQLLLQTNLSVGDIAAEVGFADALYFSRRFRLAFGCAPSEAPVKLGATKGN